MLVPQCDVTVVEQLNLTYGVYHSPHIEGAGVGGSCVTIYSNKQLPS